MDSAPSDPLGRRLLPFLDQTPVVEGLEAWLNAMRAKGRRPPRLQDPTTPSVSAAAPGEPASKKRRSLSPDTRETAERPKVKKICVRTTPTDTTFDVKDGYQWRKYGQKAICDSSYIRAYFRCAFSSSCPAKRKVQRSAKDKSMLVATYEAEHNHAEPVSQTQSLSCLASMNTPSQDLAVDLMKQGSRSNAPELHRVLVEDMASVLTTDSEFVDSLVRAVSARILEKLLGQRRR